MYGGACDPEILHWSLNKLLQVAQKELSQTLGISQKAECTVVRSYKNAIPQYNLGHSQKIQNIRNHLKTISFLTHNRKLSEWSWNKRLYRSCLSCHRKFTQKLRKFLESKLKKSMLIKSINPIRKKLGKKP